MRPSNRFPGEREKEKLFLKSESNVRTPEQGGNTEQILDVKTLENKCVASLSNSLQTLSQTNEISQRTAEQLYCQTEQLQSIENTTQEISDDLETSEYLINGMKSWWGSFSQLFYKPPKKSKKDTLYKKDNICKSDNIPSISQGINSISIEKATSLPIDRNIQVRQQSPPSEFDSNLQDGLDKLSVMLNELHGRAVEMNTCLNQQNQTLESINSRVDANRSKMEEQRREIRKLMKR